jgi:phosphoribosylformimino-5-aminoimidazole carboxamide ribotide isomerase
MPVRLIPVLDVKGGRVVHGIGGARDRYPPITTNLASGHDPLEIARALVSSFSSLEIYLADLDAISGSGTPSTDLYAKLRDLGVALWVDAGVRNFADAVRLAASRIDGIVCGLETLEGPDVVAAAVSEFGPERTILSVDLSDGTMLGNLARWPVRDSRDIGAAIECAVANGVRRIIILDLSRVGLGRGAGTEGLCRIVASTYSQLEIFAGGGISGIDELRTLRATGIAGALVASALHDGRIRPGEWPKCAGSD